MAFLVPFAFAYSEEILLNGPLLAIALHIAAAGLAVFVLALALEGFFRRPLGPVLRLLLAACGIALFAYEWRIQLAATVLALGCILVSARRSGPSPARADEIGRAHV